MVDFSVTTTTIGVVALIWLPALLRLLSLTGGRVKAAGVEASASGLLGSTDDFISDLTNIRTVTEEAVMQTPQADEKLTAVAEQVEQMAAQYLGTIDAVTDESVVRLAESYKKLRSSMEPGTERTVEMTRIVNEARVRAGADPERAKRLGSLLVRSKEQGQRIVGLAFLQEAPAPSSFEDLLTLVRDSATAFEMFHALLALKSLAPDLGRRERSTAAEILRAEAGDPRGVGVMDDPNLPSLINDVIGVLGG